MTRTLGLLTALAALAVAAPAIGAPPEGKALKGKEQSTEAKAKNVAKRACQTERREIGREAFREKYGNELGNGKFRRAMRNCKRANGTPLRAAAQEAISDCRTERDAIGIEAFREKYGTNTRGNNAFGKCVSQALKNAAKECKAERTADPDTFAETHGDRKNAFGKCVSSKVEAEPEPEPPTDET
jgi:hypothetical protein